MTSSRELKIEFKNKKLFTVTVHSYPYLPLIISSMEAEQRYLKNTKILDYVLRIHVIIKSTVKTTTGLTFQQTLSHRSL